MGGNKGGKREDIVLEEVGGGLIQGSVRLMWK